MRAALQLALRLTKATLAAQPAGTAAAAAAAVGGGGAMAASTSGRGIGAAYASWAAAGAGAARGALSGSCRAQGTTTAAAAASSFGSGWRAALAAAARQPSRGYAHGWMQFPTRGGGGVTSGWRELDPDRVLWGLIGLNVGGFLLWRTHPGLMAKHAVVSIQSLQAGRLWTALTSAFSHKDLTHLGANMIALYFFGRDTGRLFGGRRLLLLYLAGGVAGSLAHCGWYYYQAVKSGSGRYGRPQWFGYAPAALGASAAVNAITVVDILLYPTRTILLWAIIPMPAALLGVLWLLRDVTGTFEGHGQVAHAGHLGGAAAGLAFFLLFKRGFIRPRGWY